VNLLLAVCVGTVKLGVLKSDLGLHSRRGPVFDNLKANPVRQGVTQRPSLEHRVVLDFVAIPDVLFGATTRAADTVDLGKGALAELPPR